MPSCPPTAETALEPFFELSVDPMGIASFDGRFLHVNAAWEEVLGWPREALLAAPFADFVHPDDREATRAETERLAAGGRTVRFGNRYRHRDGGYRHLLWNAAADPAAGRIYAIARDVTGDERARGALTDENADLTRLNAELERLNGRLERFAYVVSHDLSEPLRSIAGFADLLERRLGGSIDDVSRDYLSRVVAATVRQQRRIADLLRYTRTTSDELRTEPVDCGALVDDVLRDLTGAREEAGGSIEVGPLPTVEADPRLLAQAFQNLLANALKFRGEDPPRVEVGAERGDGAWRFRVRDNGVGVAPEYRERVFEVFQRLDVRGGDTGTGIGLAVVRGAIERHGGRVWIADSPQPGLEVRFELPDHGTQAWA